jgi:sRNA-binding protein
MWEILADWQARWPAAFRRPVPLAVGFSGHIKAALRAEGMPFDRKRMSLVIQVWTREEQYLRAVARGVMRVHLDGRPAEVPDETARAEAQALLDEGARRRAERQRAEAAPDAGGEDAAA